jgi:ubiquinone/menaquinone biosynthesis C-methylase UbiE
MYNIAEQVNDKNLDTIVHYQYHKKTRRIMPENLNDSYSKDTIKAIDAKFEAQKIAFAPIVFQAVKALLELGPLKVISDSGERGLTLNEAAKAADISVYAAEVLLEIALGMNIVKVRVSEVEHFVLGKTGWFLLEDEMTKVNLNFVHDVCYKGAFGLTESLKTGKPAGLEVFSTEKSTIYEALASLPQQVKDSWFAFDHFYSDICFEEALPIVFSGKPKKIIDIGGNTAKWAISCCRYDPNVEVLIVDLPGQTNVAEQKAAEAGFSGRIKTLACNMLDNDTAIPSGADIIWMSQFLDCFSLEQVSRILAKVRAAAGPTTDVYILEPFWDKQRFEAAAFSLQATSLYFTCMANGNSKMYRYGKLADTIEKSGFEIAEARHKLGSNDYSLLRCRSKK